MSDCDRKRRVLMLGTLFVSACGGSGGSAPEPPAPGPSAGTPPTILGFTPTAGAPGQQVRIEGLGFVAGAVGNVVRIHNASATVLASTTTAIDVIVPSGATTGPVQVVTAGGSASTSAIFTVINDSTTPGIAWRTRRMGSPRGALAFGAGKFVAAGGSIRTSSDLLVWTDRVGIASEEDVAWDGRLFVSVGGSLTVSTSPDGLAWTPRALPAGVDSLGAVVGSGSKWVAVGRNGSIASSSDGATWTNRSLNTGAFTTLNRVIWTGTQFVAAGESGLLVTSPDGDNWTIRTVGTIDAFVGLGSSGTLIVASTHPQAGSQQALYTSPDGITWTRRGAGSAPMLFDIEVHANVWVGSGSYAMYHSSDGINWMQSTSRIDAIIDCVIHDGSKFVGTTSRHFGGDVYTSMDGATWTLVNPGERSWTGIARSPTGLMVSPAFERTQTSSDGIDWRFGGLPASAGIAPIIDVVWYPALGCFVALAQMAANQRIYTSTDGLSWTAGAYVPHNGSLAASPTLMINAANWASGNVYTSPDAVTWTQRAVSASVAITKTVWVGNGWVALGTNGALMTAPDGVSWTLRSSGTTQTLRGAVAANGLIVVVGAAGTIITSADGGANWIARPTVTNFTLNDVLWTGAEFVAIGSAGRVARSTNGTDWTAPQTPYMQTLFGTESFHLRAAVWTGTRLVVVGERDLVVTSP
jgi:photosystem II stability/assembly factor-like uncharacterized protein